MHVKKGRTDAPFEDATPAEGASGTHVRASAVQPVVEDVTALFAHDLRSPLSAIAMNLEFALAETSGIASTAVRAALEDCRAASVRAFRMLSDMVDVARFERGALFARTRVVDPRELVEPLRRAHEAEAKARNLRVEYEVLTPAFAVDPELVARAFDNLMENALRLTRVGGRVLFRIREVNGWIEVTAGTDAPPLPDATRAATFERYGTDITATKVLVNRGLGLYFCRAVAEAHGGSARLDSEPDLPTCFTMLLPREARTATVDDE